MAVTPNPPANDSRARARSAVERSSWAEAFDEFSAADRDDALEPHDLERWAHAANMLNRLAERDAIATRAHQAFLDSNDAEGAARCAFWLGFELMLERETARGNGWLARAGRVLDEAQLDSVVRGYLLLPQAIHAVSKDPSESLAYMERAVEIGRRFNERSLIAFARMGMGRAHIKLGRVAEGLSLLDEVMISVTSNEVAQMFVGGIYCAVIDACQEVFDLRRAREWTDALDRWCKAQPDLAAFQGACRVNRAAIMQLHGAWNDAMDEARRACEWLSDPPGQPAAGAAFYRAAELNRVRGELAEAEVAYRAANECGRQPYPGLAQLWFAQSRVGDATAAMQRLLRERQGTRTRVPVLEAAVEIMIAAGDVEAARAASDELSGVASELSAPYLSAAAAHARGAVSLASGDARAALDDLRTALSSWRELGAPFEAGRTRVLIALASRALADEGTAAFELDAARRAFELLGAKPDAARVGMLQTPVGVDRGGALTDREAEVLALVAAGKTNREIASALRISEKTVARHVSNIFMKLGLPNRAAATAYAYEHKLVRPVST
jgi:DNA-binding CsgD family transcriptional regulator